MKKTRIKNVIVSACTVWLIAITAFAISYLFPILTDPDLQANLVLSIVLIPSAAFGAHIYYKKGYTTNGFILGSSMFLLAIFLDALITVPVFIIPFGGNHLSFFSDSGFWLIALEYIIVVAAYRQLSIVIEAPKKIL